MAEPAPEDGATRRRARRARRRQLLAVLVALAAAAPLLILAVPRTVALVGMMPAERTFGRLERRLPVERDAIEAAIRSGLAASAWIDSAALWQRIASGHLGRMRLLAGDRQAQADALLQAEATLQRSLARRPGNPFAWWHLAAVANALGRPGDQVTGALRLSVVTGDRVDALLFPRLQLALARWSQLDAATREVFRPQLARALRRDPKEFVTLVRRSLAEDEVRTALRGERNLLVEYEGLLDRSLRLPASIRTSRTPAVPKESGRQARSRAFSGS
ncbi:MAG TPA: hypothetical protein VLE23_07190 [Geminicoccaceae bacterium]|nr:hypothetical protein [Geminicoccaceae bacterium]